MGIGPVPAIEKVLAQTGLKKEDIDTWEVCMKVLQVSFISDLFDR